MKLSLAEKHYNMAQAEKEGLYERDGLKVYVGGFDRRLGQFELEEWLIQFGPLNGV